MIALLLMLLLWFEMPVGSIQVASGFSVGAAGKTETFPSPTAIGATLVGSLYLSNNSPVVTFRTRQGQVFSQVSGSPFAVGDGSFLHVYFIASTNDQVTDVDINYSPGRQHRLLLWSTVLLPLRQFLKLFHFPELAQVRLHRG